MRYRVYFKHPDQKEEDWEVREVEAIGEAYRICDDHGRVVFGKPWPKREAIPPQGFRREPLPYN